MSLEDIRAIKDKLDPEEYLELLYYNFPSLWIEEHVPMALDASKMITLRNYQVRVVNDPKRKKILRFGRQCLTGDTLVQMSNGTLKEIRHVKPNDNILSFNEINNSIVPDIVTDQWSNGTRQIYKITTQFGRVIRATSNHPFFVKQQICDKTHNMTIDKMQGIWSTIEDGLEVGQKIAVPLQTPEVTNSTYIGSEWAKLLGYILSDGSCSIGQSLKFTNIKEEYLIEFEQIIHTLGVGTKRYKKGNGYDIIVTNGRTGRSNKILQQIEEYGMRQSKASKDIPDVVMSLCNIDLSLFINRLFAGDGYISTFYRTGRTTSKSEIGIGMPSLSFLQKLQTLLYRFGVDSYINEEINGKKQQTRFWKLRISNKQSILRFFNSIGLIYGKESQCVEAINNTLLLSDKFNREEGDIKWDYIKSI
jgi:replicative DNA helicase